MRRPAKTLGQQLVEAEKALRVAKAFSEMRESEHHKVLCAHLQQMEFGVTEELVYTALNHDERDERRGAIKMLQWLRTLANAGAQRLDAQVKKVEDLKRRIEILNRQRGLEQPSDGSEAGLPVFGEATWPTDPKAP